MAKRPVVPRAITREDAGLRIEWEPGHEAFYPARALRLGCGCAVCVDEMSGRPLLDPATVPDDVRPVSLALVGGYGLRIGWSDGHGTGIYTFERLREECGCPRCTA
jgi:ATP-binding protein involved in chromosome partitioning